jgi:NhaA family Na+:H+ antiporter
VRLGWAAMPAGIGFTTAVFVMMLAAGQQSPATNDAKLAVLVGFPCASALRAVLLRNTPAMPQA